jgi:hypothetical protein
LGVQKVRAKVRAVLKEPKPPPILFAKAPGLHLVASREQNLHLLKEQKHLLLAKAAKTGKQDLCQVYPLSPFS